MTVLDRSVEFKKVLMVIARKTIKHEIPLMEGFQYVSYTDSLCEPWCNLHINTKLFTDQKQAHEKWDRMLRQDEAFFKENFLFVTDSSGKLVGSAGLWPGTDFEEGRLRIHYVSVLEEAQHNRIAQAMISKLCMKYDQIPGKYPLYLATQSQSYGAIALYVHMGFTPYLGAYNDCSQEENEAAWEFTTQFMREKAK